MLRISFRNSPRRNFRISPKHIRRFNNPISFLEKKLQSCLRAKSKSLCKKSTHLERLARAKSSKHQSARKFKRNRSRYATNKITFQRNNLGRIFRNQTSKNIQRILLDNPTLFRKIIFIFNFILGIKKKENLR